MINQYKNEAKLLDLCEKINMPKEATKKLIEILNSFDFSKIEPYFSKLFEMDTALEAFQAITTILKEEKDTDGFIWLTIYLIGALKTYEHYQTMGIDDQIYYDTFAIFSRFVNEHYESYSRFGYDRAFWNYRQLAQNLYRLGSLEFEMKKYTGEEISLNNKVIIKDQGNVLSVHIPSDAKISVENNHESYKQATQFFKTYYPDFQYEYFICNTWMLSENLKYVLSETSNILNFKKDYDICYTNEENDGYKFWVFKNPALEVEDFPENTSLQRNIKNHVKNGGKIGSSLGVIHKDKFII